MLDTLQSAGPSDPSTETERAVAARAPWFHNLHLPDGTQTALDHPLGDFPAFKWREIAPHVPADLSGWRVLDIGCNAGFYTFELARRGADVLGIDVDPHYLAQARWAAERFGLAARTTFRQMQVYDLARLNERFDLVWFMGVLYHLRYPLLALDLVAEKVGRMLVFQTLTMPGSGEGLVPEDVPIHERERLAAPEWPKMAFVERRLAGDPTNWWTPDAGCCEALLRACGLRVTARPGHEVFVAEPGPAPPHDDLRQSQLHAAVGRGGLGQVAPPTL